jgi:hypothetical protein
MITFLKGRFASIILWSFHFPFMIYQLSFVIAQAAAERIKNEKWKLINGKFTAGLLRL